MAGSAAHTELTHAEHPPLSNAVRHAPLPGNIDTLHTTLWWTLNPDFACLPAYPTRLSTSFSTENPHRALPLPRTDRYGNSHPPFPDGNPFSIQRTDGSIGHPPSTIHHPPSTIHAGKEVRNTYICYVRDAAALGCDRNCYVRLPLSNSLCC